MVKTPPSGVGDELPSAYLDPSTSAQGIRRVLPSSPYSSSSSDVLPGVERATEGVHYKEETNKRSGRDEHDEGLTDGEGAAERTHAPRVRLQR